MKKIMLFTLTLLMFSSCSLSKDNQEITKDNQESTKDSTEEVGATGVDYIVPFPDEEVGGAKDIL